MLILFPSKVELNQNTLCVVTAVVEESSTIRIVQGSCSLVVGEYSDTEKEEQTVTVTGGTTINLKFLTKAGYAAKDTFEFDVDGKRSFFLYCTKDDPALVFDPYYRGKSFLDTVSARNGDRVEYENDNTLEFFDIEGLQTTINLNSDSTADASGIEFSDSLSYVLDNRSGEIYKVDVENKLLVSTLNLGSPATGIAITKKPMSNEKVTWLTLADGRVLCLDKDEKIIKQLAIQGVATGIDTSVDGRMVVICDTTANQVHIYENTGDNNWKSSLLPSAGYPYDVFVDAQKNVWVTSKIGTKMQVFPFGSKVPVEIDVGSGQKTVKQINERTVGVVCTESNEIVMLDTRTKAQKERISFPHPVDISVVDKVVYIANAESKIYKMELSGSSVSGQIVPYLDAMPTIYSLDADSDTKSLIVAKLYGNTPNMLATPNRKIDKTGFEAPPQIFSKKYESDSVYARGIDAPIEVYSPLGFDLSLEVSNNGIIDTANIAKPDAKIKFEFVPTGDDDEKIVFPILIGNTVLYFESKLKITTAEIRPFRFHNTMLTELENPYVSNAVTISGLLEDQLGEFRIIKNHPKIRVLVNGIESIDAYSQDPENIGKQQLHCVKNGDVVEIVANLEPQDFTQNSIFLRASCEDFFTNWQLLHVDLARGEVVTKPYTHTIPHQSLNWNLGSWSEISVYDLGLNKIKQIGLWPEDISGESVSGSEILVCDYAKKSVYVIDSDTDTACFSRYLDSGPYQALIIGELVYVSKPDANSIAILDRQLNFVGTKELNYSPYGLAELDGDLVVMGGETGKVYFYTPLDSGLQISESLLLNGNLIDVQKNDTDLWITDFDNAKIKVVKNRMLHRSIPVGHNPTGLAFEKNSATVVSNYDNSVTKINLADFATVTTPLFRPVHKVCVFGDTELFLDMQTSSIVQGLVTENIEDDANPSVTKTQKQNSDFIVVGQKLYVLHLASEYINILEERIWASSDEFITQPKVDITSPIVSNHIVFDYMSRPQTVSVPKDSVENYHLIHNMVTVGTEAIIKEGDTIAIVATTPRHWATEQEVLLSGKNYVQPFVFQTMPNYVPDYIKFETIFGTSPGEWVTSSVETISGLSENVVAQIQCSDRYVVVFVNNKIAKELGSIGLFDVSNGDTIHLMWEVELNENASANQHNLTSVIPDVLFATWNIYQLALGSVANLGVFVNWTNIRYDPATPLLAKLEYSFADPRVAVGEAFTKTQTAAASLEYFADTTEVLRSDSDTPKLYKSQIFLVSPYTGAILFLSKMFWEKLTLGGITKNRIYKKDNNGPTQRNEKFGQTGEYLPITRYSKRFVLQNNGGIANTKIYKHLIVTKKQLQDRQKRFLFDSKTTTSQKEHCYLNSIQSFVDGKTSDNTFAASPYTATFDLIDYAASFKDSTLNSNAYKVFEFYTDTPENIVFWGMPQHNIVTEPVGYEFIYYSFDVSNTNKEANYYFDDTKIVQRVEADYYFQTESQPSQLSSFAVPTTVLPLLTAPQNYTSFYVYNVTADAHYYSAEDEAKPLVEFDIKTNSHNHVLFSVGQKTQTASTKGYANTPKGIPVIAKTYVVDDPLEFFKYGTKTPSLGKKSQYFMSVELSSKINQSSFTEKKRGAYSEPDLINYIDTNDDFEEFTLKPYKLVDGSWMHYHPNKMAYGKCMIYNYIVERGLVRGG